MNVATPLTPPSAQPSSNPPTGAELLSSLPAHIAYLNPNNHPRQYREALKTQIQRAKLVLEYERLMAAVRKENGNA